jgi:hypothetical protein
MLRILERQNHIYLRSTIYALGAPNDNLQQSNASLASRPPLTGRSPRHRNTPSAAALIRVASSRRHSLPALHASSGLQLPPKLLVPSRPTAPKGGAARASLRRLVTNDDSGVARCLDDAASPVPNGVVPEVLPVARGHWPPQRGQLWSAWAAAGPTTHRGSSWFLRCVAAGGGARSWR